MLGLLIGAEGGNEHFGGKSQTAEIAKGVR
jgi:hypothetical protein